MAAKHEKLLKLLPGLTEVRSALTAYWEDADYNDAAMEHFNVSGDMSAPNLRSDRVTDEDLARLEKQYPAAYAYARAERRKRLGLSPEYGDEEFMEALENGANLTIATAAKEKIHSETVCD